MIKSVKNSEGLTLNKIPLIIDSDPGIDDTLALIYAFSKEVFDIKAVHTVSGNVSIEHTTENARGVLGLIGQNNVPVHAGAARPLVNNPIFADDIHGENGLGGANIPEDLYVPLQETSAFQSYVDILSKADEKITIVAVGPLTNLAVVLRAYPELNEKIAQVVIMGGGIGRGNTTPAAEFNFYADPHAAKIVSESGLKIVLSGLNVTDFTRVYESDFKDLATTNEKLSEFLLNLNGDYIEKISGDGRYITPHDVMAFMYLTHPDIFTTEEMAIIVDANDGPTMGMTYSDNHRKKAPNNMTVITEADNEAYRNELMAAIKETTINL